MNDLISESARVLGTVFEGNDRISKKEFLMNALNRIKKHAENREIQKKAEKLAYEWLDDHYEAQTASGEEFGDLCLEFAKDED